jgi:hypothetical protein
MAISVDVTAFRPVAMPPVSPDERVLAPGIYVEGTRFRVKSIEGAPTSMTGFAGMRAPDRCTPVFECSHGDPSAPSAHHLETAR